MTWQLGLWAGTSGIAIGCLAVVTATVWSRARRIPPAADVAALHAALARTKWERDLWRSQAEAMDRECDTLTQKLRAARIELRGFKGISALSKQDD